MKLRTRRQYNYTRYFEGVGLTTVVKCTFKGWTDTKGNAYPDSVVKVTVAGAETYTAHFEYQVDDPMLLSHVGDQLANGVSSVRQDTTIYNLTGQRLAVLRKGICIVNGRKTLINK